MHSKPLIGLGHVHESDWIERYVAASVVPYAIGSGKPVLEYPGADWIQFIEEPMTFSAGPDQIDACMVGQTDEQILIAVRATEHGAGHGDLAGLKDWLNNFKSTPVSAAELRLPGKLHAGFLGSWMRLEAVGALTALLDLQRKTGKGVAICGYSKGGGVAPIVAMRLLAAGLPVNAIDAVVLFEAPRAGDADFAKAYQSQLGGKTTRYAYQNDVIPHLPPAHDTLMAIQKMPVAGDLLAYFYGNFEEWTPTPVGTLHFIDWEDCIVQDTPTIEQERPEQLASALRELHWNQTFKDHLPATGFARVLVPHRVCPWHF